MLIKLANEVWLDPQRVVLIQRVIKPHEPLPAEFPVLVEIRMVDEVAQFLFQDVASAQQFVDRTAALVNEGARV